ncbi:unnamed protein product [Diamesa hyperborea]
MKCYYEVLDLERDADDSAIKKSYKKLALKYHPDKNIDDPITAKEKFQLIVQAYEVLLDPNERAWYDRHRDQILKGNQENYEDNSLDVFPYFTTACFKGFNDDEEGFYTVYRNVFEKLATEDIEYMDDPAEYETIPNFGKSSSNTEFMLKFYNYWESYCTKKSFVWLYTHNINEIRDRRILKLVDKEHKKIQQKARKERNEEIRNLVMFVKKRDRRFVEYKKLLEEKAQLNRLKSQQNNLEQIKKRNQDIAEQQKNSKGSVEQQEQMRQLEEKYLNQYDDDSESSSDEISQIDEDLENCDLNDENYDDELYCVACNKFFMNESTKINHDSSKKHKFNLELLQAEMSNEESNFQMQNAEVVQENDEKDDEVLDEEEEEEVEIVKKSKGKKSKKKNKKVFNYDANTDEEEEVFAAENIETPGEEVILEEEVKKESSEEELWDNNKKGKKSKTKKPKSESSKLTVEPTLKETDEELTSKQEANIESSDDEFKNNNKKSKKSKAKKTKPESSKLKVEAKDSDEEDYPKVDVKKKVKPVSDDDDEEQDNELSCVTCHQLFTSKNKLFTHLKKTNHSVFISDKFKAVEKPEKNSRRKK